MNTIIRGIILGLSITAPVGPTNIEVIRRGMRDGWKSAVTFCAWDRADHIESSHITTLDRDHGG